MKDEEIDYSNTSPTINEHKPSIPSNAKEKIQLAETNEAIK